MKYCAALENECANLSQVDCISTSVVGVARANRLIRCLRPIWAMSD